MQRFANYELVRELGRGATARIYLAEHVETKAQVSLKIFHPQIFSDSHFAQRIQRELKVSAELKHPNIVAVEELLPTDPPALVMEYVEGSNLEIFQGRLPYVLPELSALIIIEILKALEYAHGLGLVHRDLKPENVLIRVDGKVFVTDFGLAKMLDTTMITQTNVIMGSLDYMSPEQARGESVTVLSDLFSVGVMLYFLTTGTRPFTRANTVTTLAAIKEELAESPHQRNPKLCAEFSRIIQKSMSKNFADRYQTAREFREALENYMSGIGLADFRFGQWMAQSTSVTLDSLRTASEALIRRGDECLRQKNWDGLLEVLAHLSLKAPQSGALSRLTEEYRLIQQGAKRKRWAYILPVVVLILTLVSVKLFWNSHSVPPRAQTEMAAVVPQAPAPSMTKPVSAPQPHTAAVVSAAPAKSEIPPRVGSVRFYVTEDTTVFWDGVQIANPNELLVGQTLGSHRLILSRKGFDPIKTQVKVTAGKPVVVNAR